MKTPSLLFIFALLWTSSLSLSAQAIQTITPGKIWHIESGYACPAGDEVGCFCYHGLDTIKIGNIKVFNGKEYYELLTGDGVLYHPSFKNAASYVREEGKKVFFYTEKCDKEYLMCDFNLNVGDEVFLVDPLYPVSYYNRENPCELTKDDIFQFKVTEVDSIEYNQIKRKRLRLEGLYPYFNIWVEGIGCMRGITYLNSPRHISGAHQLKDCHEVDELIFINENPEYDWCWTTAIDDVRQDLIGIFTDEKNILYVVNAENIPLTIYDLQGRKIQSFSPDNNHYQINISFLPKGLYIISNEIKNINFKVIRK